VIQAMLTNGVLTETWSDADAEAWWQRFRQQTVIAPSSATDVSPVGATVAYPSIKEVGNETAAGNP
jgi:hypothetical protein